MSKGGSGSGGTQTVQTNSTSAPPQWVQNANRDVYSNAQNVAQTLQPQQVAQVAPMTGGQTSLIDSLMGNVGSQNGTYSGALGTLSGLQGYGAPKIAPGQLSSTNLSPYMNPYTASVINTTNAQAQQARQQSLNQTDASSAGAGAFGGSRQGVQEGVTNAQADLGMANLDANLNQQNFAQAQGAASSDIGTKLAADTTNAGNDVNSAALRESSANSAISGAGQQQQTYLNGLMAALGGQGMVQGQQQAVNEQQAGQSNANRQNNIDQVSLLQQILSGLNVGGTTTGTQVGQTAQPSSGAGQILGGALGVGGSLASMLGTNGFNVMPAIARMLA